MRGRTPRRKRKTGGRGRPGMVIVGSRYRLPSRFVVVWGRRGATGSARLVHPRKRQWQGFSLVVKGGMTIFFCRRTNRSFQGRPSPFREGPRRMPRPPPPPRERVETPSCGAHTGCPSVLPEVPPVHGSMTARGISPPHVRDVFRYLLGGEGGGSPGRGTATTSPLTNGRRRRRRMRMQRVGRGGGRGERARRRWDVRAGTTRIQRRQRRQRRGRRRRPRRRRRRKRKRRARHRL